MVTATDHSFVSSPIINTFLTAEPIMDAPQLVLVPATPLSYAIPSPGKPLSNSTDPPIRKSKRQSSETAIVSIYGMYGEQDGHASWAPALAPVVKRKKSAPTQFRPLPTPPSAPEMDPLDDDHGYDLSYLSQPDPPETSGMALTNDHAQLSAAALSSRPNSRHSKTSSAHTFETASSGRSSTESKPESRLTLSPSMGDIDKQSSGRARSRSPRKRQPEPLRKSVFATMELPPVPTSSDDLAPSRSQTPHKTPPPSRPVTPSNRSLSPANVPPANVSRTPSPARKQSPAPPDGEDPDGFFVRSTYSLLDVRGVKGDGYEEGVERTRARIGPSAASQRVADLAIADDNEKKRELTLQELALLGNLDRYGFFFNNSSHERLVLLPAEPLRKRLSNSSTKSAKPPSTVSQLSSLPPTPLPSREDSRIGKWNRMLVPGNRDAGGNIESWRIKPSKEAKLRRRVYKGIPDRWRAAAWDLLLSRYASSGPWDLAKYATDFREAADKPSTYDIQIDLDVPRTISGHVLFHTRYGAGQRSLFHVLHAFSMRCSECGYVQGMGPIAATLLCYVEPEHVYTSLVRLHNAYDLHRLFKPGFPGLLEAIFVQERLTHSTMPAVYTAFSRNGVSTTAYATKWYITLFANSVPFQTQLRLWDAFMLDGPDVFIAMSVAIVWAYRDQITSRAANFETILSLLSSFFVPQDEDALLSWIGKTLNNRKLRAKMTKWRAEWRGLVSRGEDGKALL